MEATAMTAADLRTLAELLDQLAAAGFVVALEFGGEITIKARPAASIQGEPFADDTRFTDGTGWVEGEPAR
jgi:hypothetical protein